MLSIINLIRVPEPLQAFAYGYHIIVVQLLIIFYKAGIGAAIVKHKYSTR